MIFIERIKFIERIDHLIRSHATGSPKNLSEKLYISERHVYNLINIMKEMGAPIFYCQHSQSYRYDEEVFFNSGFFTRNLRTDAYKGGGTQTADLSLMFKYNNQHSIILGYWKCMESNNS